MVYSWYWKPGLDSSSPCTRASLLLRLHRTLPAFGCLVRAPSFVGDGRRSKTKPVGGCPDCFLPKLCLGMLANGGFVCVLRCLPVCAVRSAMSACRRVHGWSCSTAHASKVPLLFALLPCSPAPHHGSLRRRFPRSADLVLILGAGPRSSSLERRNFNG